MTGVEREAERMKVHVVEVIMTEIVAGTEAMTVEVGDIIIIASPLADATSIGAMIDEAVQDVKEAEVPEETADTIEMATRRLLLSKRSRRQSFPS